MKLWFQRRAGYVVCATARVCALVGLVAMSGPTHALSSAPQASWNLIPHRAVYDMVLDPDTSGTKINNVSGRLVFEITGSPCEGFTQNMRMVTRVDNSRGGGQTTDVRTSSWEGADGATFRFSSSLYTNSKKTEGSQGDAKRGPGDGVKVTLVEPKKASVEFKGGVMFPAQHTIAILGAALDGKSNLATQLYDGSEGGKKIYDTVTYIGKGKSVGRLGSASLIGALSEKKAWPVTIAFYEIEKNKNDDATPVYELGFQFFENGVSGNLSIAYRSFTLKGKLVKLETMPVTDCKK